MEDRQADRQKNEIVEKQDRSEEGQRMKSKWKKLEKYEISEKEEEKGEDEKGEEKAAAMLTGINFPIDEALHSYVFRAEDEILCVVLRCVDVFMVVCSSVSSHQSLDILIPWPRGSSAADLTDPIIRPRFI